jgi:hypothetical protein
VGCTRDNRPCIYSVPSFPSLTHMSGGKNTDFQTSVYQNNLPESGRTQGVPVAPIVKAIGRQITLEATTNPSLENG